MTGVTVIMVYWQGTLCGTFHTVPFGFKMAFICAKANFMRIVSPFCVTKAWNSSHNSKYIFVYSKLSFQFVFSLLSKENMLHYLTEGTTILTDFLFCACPGCPVAWIWLQGLLFK